MIACLCAFIGNTNRNPLVQFKETENKRDLLAREVVGALISSYWAHGWLEVPEIKWVQTNNYKFHTFRSVHFDPSQSPRPSFHFPRVWFRDSGGGEEEGGKIASIQIHMHSFVRVEKYTVCHYVQLCMLVHVQYIYSVSHQKLSRQPVSSLNSHLSMIGFDKCQHGINDEVRTWISEKLTSGRVRNLTTRNYTRRTGSSSLHSKSEVKVGTQRYSIIAQNTLLPLLGLHSQYNHQVNVLSGETVETLHVLNKAHKRSKHLAIMAVLVEHAEYVQQES